MTTNAWRRFWTARIPSNSKRARGKWWARARGSRRHPRPMLVVHIDVKNTTQEEFARIVAALSKLGRPKGTA